ncbi:queuosine precursor transporter [Microbaculum marinum]|uniref:Probable queuosine precursor transporter n=1 Tax=Microbaculum marinum TaxID=1764581 RepID=A0AAW9RDJ2_9HYPH
MSGVVIASNILVQHPFTPFGLQDYLTWGAFTYPFAFLVTDLTNRRFGPSAARKVVYAGFAIAVLLSIILATPRIALASGTAFLTAQLIDVAVFHRLRRRFWWQAPLASSMIGSTVDTALFFTLAFAGSGVGEATYWGLVLPVWIGWAVVDYLVKLLHALVMLGPFHLLRGATQPEPEEYPAL